MTGNQPLSPQESASKKHNQSQRKPQHKPKLADSQGFWTVQQAASYLQVHPNTLRRWLRLGKFPRIPMPGAGKDYRFTKDLIDEWAKNRSLGTR
jgi:excisionase family DNA binding protein